MKLFAYHWSLSNVILGKIKPTFKSTVVRWGVWICVCMHAFLAVENLNSVLKMSKLLLLILQESMKPWNVFKYLKFYLGGECCWWEGDGWFDASKYPEGKGLIKFLELLILCEVIFIFFFFKQKPGDLDMTWCLWPLWLLSECAADMVANSYLWLRGETAAFVILLPCQICGWFPIRCLQCRRLNYARESAAVVVYVLLHWWKNCKLPHVRPQSCSFTWWIRILYMLKTSMAGENTFVFSHRW